MYGNLSAFQMLLGGDILTNEDLAIGLAMSILETFPKLAHKYDGKGRTPLDLLATKPLSFNSGSPYSLVNLGSRPFIPLQLIAIFIYFLLAWLSIIAYRNKDKNPGEKLVSVSDVVKEHWASCGRNFFSRYDYEECESEGANKMIDYLRDLVSKSKPGDKYGSYVLQFADDFAYSDPVDGIVALKQGVRFVFSDGSRIIFRLSGTGSAGATVRMYIEQFEPDVSEHDMDAHCSKTINRSGAVCIKAEGLHWKGEAYSYHINLSV
ncbi:hypothetical protein ACSBR2_034318 [Camellia fascicularis]